VTGEAHGASTTEGDAETGHTRRIIGWSLVGAGGALAVGAVVAGLIAKSNSDKLTSASQSMGQNVFDPSWESTGKNANRAMIGLAIGAGAAAVAGVIVLVTAPSSVEAPAEGAPSPATARATVAPWLAGGLVGAGATLQF
jgi:hypothetical protein